VVVADAEASSRFLLYPTEALGYALPDRLERLVVTKPLHEILVS
jgi:hypothetical protein